MNKQHTILAFILILFVISICVVMYLNNTVYSVEFNTSTKAPIIESTTISNSDLKEEMLTIEIGNHTLTAKLEDNESAIALKNMIGNEKITITVSNYGGFEKIGTLPQSLPQNDKHIMANPGDIMLYQGDSIVFFYGTNSWSYTKLATITNISSEELNKILSGNDSIISLSIEHQE